MKYQLLRGLFVVGSVILPRLVEGCFFVFSSWQKSFRSFDEKMCILSCYIELMFYAAVVIL